MVAGRLFHKRGAVDEKRHNEVLVLERGMFSCSSVNERRLHDGPYCCNSDVKYVGKSSL